MNIEDSLKSFGLTDNEQEIYLLLARKGWSTVLQIARDSSVKRTTLYRVLDSLQKKGLVEVELDDKTTHYNAAPAKQFEALVIKEEKSAKKLRDSYDAVSEHLQIITEAKQGETGVRFFRGKRGLEHLDWKLCNTPSSEVLIFDCGNKWYEYLGREFAEQVRAEMVEKQITIREVYNSVNHKPIAPDGTCEWTDNKIFASKHYQGKVIAKSILLPKQDLYIVAGKSIHLHSYRDGDLFGVEIINQDYAQMMTQLFEVIWSLAKDS